MDPLTSSIIIPCHNEEKTIEKCLDSCLRQSWPAKQIIVVDDGSSDDSVKKIKEFGNLVTLIKLKKNTGNKSYVQQIALRYVTADVFISTDADSILDKDFIKNIAGHFRDPLVSAVSGYVVSLAHNWLTALREIDYVIGQEIHKTAQANIGFLFVIPGCAAAFRTAIFKNNIAFDHDTLTEDLDFTYKLHQKNLVIIYEKKALVYTQDPEDLSSYVKQMRRWFGGGWQNLMKHKSIIKRQPAGAFELSLIYIEGLTFPLVMFGLPAVNFSLYVSLLTSYIAVAMCMGLFAAGMRRRADLFLWSPLYFIIAYVNLYIFYEQFIKEVILRKKNMVWLSPKRHH